MNLDDYGRRLLRDIDAGLFSMGRNSGLNPYRDAGLIDFEPSTASPDIGVWRLTAKGQAAIA